MSLAAHVPTHVRLQTQRPTVSRTFRAAPYEEVRRVTSCYGPVGENNSDWLRRDTGAGVSETGNSHEVPFERALVFRTACCNRLKADDVGASAKSNSSLRSFRVGHFITIPCLCA